MNIMAYVHSLTGEGGPSAFRSSALDGAIQAAERIPGVRITAVALDDPGGEEALRTSLAFAVDEALLLREPRIDGYDCTALGCLLADAIWSVGCEQGLIDAVFCSDNDPGQDGLGPALAGHLGWPQVTGTSKVEVDGENFMVWRNWDDECTLLRVRTPCVISFLPSTAPANYPQLSRLMAANQAKIPIWMVEAVPNLQEALSFSAQPRRRQIAYRESPEDVRALVNALLAEHLI